MILDKKHYSFKRYKNIEKLPFLLKHLEVLTSQKNFEISLQHQRLACKVTKRKSMEFN